MTEAQLLEGKAIGQKIRQELSLEIERIKAADGTSPSLNCVIVGRDPASESFLRSQEKTALSLGLGFKAHRFPAEIPERGLIDGLRSLNAAPDVHGIIIQMPLPAGIDPSRVTDALDPRKDVEGVHPTSLGLMVLRKARLIPSTPLACLTLIDAAAIDCRGKEAVIVGQSAIVGRPLALLLGDRRATLTICNTGTAPARLAGLVRGADILVACAGRPRLIAGSWIKEGACVIDVGTTPVEGTMVGDVEFEEAKRRAKFITPVPGGVGPLTVLMLMKNLVQAYKWQKEALRGPEKS